MSLSVIAFCALMVALVAHRRAVSWHKRKRTFVAAQPRFYGIAAGLWVALPALALYVFWSLAQTAIMKYALKNGSVDAAHEFVAMCMLGLAVLGAFVAFKRLQPLYNARVHVEKLLTFVLFICAASSVLITFSIILSVLFEAIRFFRIVSPLEFLFGTHWSPQMAVHADQAGSSGAFGAVPLFAGTLLVTFIAMLVAAPLGLMAAIYLAEYANKKTRHWAKPILEMLAGIPTVVYGYVAVIFIAPALQGFGAALGLSVASESALVAGLVMGIMIIPFISSLADDVIHAIPQTLRDASYGLGATQAETITKVVLPAALPGIMGALLLGMSRAIGETMIVVMAAGLAANLTANPLDAVTTVTVQMVTLLVGDHEFDSAKTLAAFALGLALFVITLILNIIAMWIVKRYREQVV